MQMRTTILAEDDQILVCMKPAGLAVESSRVGETDMVSELKKYLVRNGGNPYVGLVHRLDQPVSGLLVVGKTKEAAAALSAQVSGEKLMQKEYAALLYCPEDRRDNVLSDEATLWEDWLWKVPGENRAEIVSAGNKGAKKAKLSILCREREEDPTCLEANILLQTGRFHQIRVQCASRGLAILGDRKYGSSESLSLSEHLQIRQLCLCARRLEFIHPKTGKEVCYEWNQYPWSRG